MRKVNYFKNKMGKMLLILAVILGTAFQANAQYCASSNTNIVDEWINNVTFAGINWTSGSTTYQNYTAQVANVMQGMTYPISVSVTNGTGTAFTETVRVWVDWNQNQVFDVPSEQYDLGVVLVGGGTTHVFSGNIAVPAGATIGTTRMRVTLRFSTYAGPCDAFTWGEVEDYGVTVASSGPPPPPPVPANDLCANAIAISCSSSTNGTTISSTADATPTCTTTNTSPGVWYTMVGNGEVFTLSLCGASWDTKISVYTGACGALTCVVGNDDFCSLQSQVEFLSTAGTTYRILVHGFLQNVGTFTLNATCAPLCPAPISSPWTVTAINGATGTALRNCDATFSVSSTGVGTATADKIHFVHQTLTGNGYVVADINSFTNWTYGGVQFRDGLTAGARKVALQTQLGSRVTRELRTTANGSHTVSQLAAPRNNYVRIARVGDVFTSSVSGDGVNWTQVNSVTVAGLPSTMNVGFYVNSQLASSGTVNFESAGVFSGSALNSEVDNRNGNISDYAAINAFPNPASNELNINMGHLTGEKVQVTVMNSIGQVSMLQNFDTVNEVERLDISKLSSGVYFLQINNEATQKFIVNK